MQKNLLIILTYIISLVSYSQDNKDYTFYHKLINKGEIFFLQEKNVDSSLYYYEKAFKEFDFIFVKDVVNASQIAYYSKKDYKKYLIKGFDFGLTLNHLRWIKLFEPDLKKLLVDKVLVKEHSVRRKKYLEKLDLDYLNTLYTMGLQDQRDKWNPKAEDYIRKRDRDFEKTEKLIREKGFPGEKLLGIQDSSVFRDSNSKYKDLTKLISEDATLKSYFKSDDQILSQQMIYLIIIHNFCSHTKLNDLWLKEIRKGNIHPRDVALFHDNMYRASSCKNPVIPYKNNLFVNYNKYEKMDKKINEQREKLFITSLEIDDLKKVYEKQYGFKFFWGFWDCR